MPDKHTVIITVVKEGAPRKLLTLTRTVYAFHPYDILRPLDKTMDEFPSTDNKAWAPTTPS